MVQGFNNTILLYMCVCEYIQYILEPSAIPGWLFIVRSRGRWLWDNCRWWWRKPPCGGVNTLVGVRVITWVINPVWTSRVSRTALRWWMVVGEALGAILWAMALDVAIDVFLRCSHHWWAWRVSKHSWRSRRRRRRRQSFIWWRRRRRRWSRSLVASWRRKIRMTSHLLKVQVSQWSHMLKDNKAQVRFWPRIKIIRLSFLSFCDNEI